MFILEYLESIKEALIKLKWCNICNIFTKWKWKSLSLIQLFASPGTIYNPWNSPGQNTGVAVLFSRGSSQPRDQTQVFCIAGRFFTSWSHQGSPRILEWVAYPFSSGLPTQESNLHCRQIDLLTWCTLKCVHFDIIEKLQTSLFIFPSAKSLHTIVNTWPDQFGVLEIYHSN